MHRKLLLVAGVLLAAACGDAKNMFVAKGKVAARAGDLTLSPERLAEILSGPRGHARHQGRRRLRDQPVGGLRAVRAGRGGGQAPARFRQRGEGALARARRAAHHALARHDRRAPPAGRSVGARQPVLGGRGAGVPAHPLRHRPERHAAGEGRGAQAGRGHARAHQGRRRFRQARERALGRSRQQARQRLPPARPARPVRAAVRQRGLGARARRPERRRRDPVRLPHHPASRRRRRPRAAHRRSWDSVAARRAIPSTWISSPRRTSSRWPRTPRPT